MVIKPQLTVRQSPLHHTWTFDISRLRYLFTISLNSTTGNHFYKLDSKSLQTIEPTLNAKTVYFSGAIFARQRDNGLLLHLFSINFIYGISFDQFRLKDDSRLFAALFIDGFYDHVCRSFTNLESRT